MTRCRLLAFQVSPIQKPGQSLLFQIWFELGLDSAVANDDLNLMKSKEDNNSGSVLVFGKTMVRINLWFYFLLNSCVKKNIWNNAPVGPITEAPLSYYADSTSNNKAFRPVFNSNKKKGKKKKDSFCALQSIVARTANGSLNILPPPAPVSEMGQDLFRLWRREAEHSSYTAELPPAFRLTSPLLETNLSPLSCASALPSMGWSPARKPPSHSILLWDAESQIREPHYGKKRCTRWISVPSCWSALLCHLYESFI